MAYRNGNYSAFYVAEPFREGNLGAHATRDFVFYNLLRAWKARDSSLPFVDSHEKNYNVGKPGTRRCHSSTHMRRTTTLGTVVTGNAR